MSHDPSPNSTSTSHKIRTDLKAGDLGRLISIHGEVYDSLEGYGLRFEAYVARTIAEYFIDNLNQGRVWFAERDDVLLGCIAIAHRPNNRAQLRWLVVRPEARGLGLGRTLVDRSISYCEERGFDAIFLETTDGLDASMHIYEKRGFTIVSSTIEPLWENERPLIVMEKKL